jgi:hypothetical protein
MLYSSDHNASQMPSLPSVFALLHVRSRRGQPLSSRSVPAHFTKGAYSMFKLTIIALTFFATSQAFAAGPKQCQRDFSNILATCAHSLRFLSAGLRAGNQGECVRNAIQTERACSGAGASACLIHCEATYNGNFESCVGRFNPVSCGSDTNCGVLQDQATCISQAVFNLRTCSSSCPQ